MFFIPGWLIALLTFPGVMVHELAHQFFCDLSHVPVYKVCYFQRGNPSGYVIHASTADLRANLLISVGPLLVNTFLCAALASPGMISVMLRAQHTPFVHFFLIWLGVSIGMHAIPSNQDIRNFVEALKQSRHAANRLMLGVAKVFSVFFLIANLLRAVWLDFFYALLVAGLLPWIVTGISPLRVLE